MMKTDQRERSKALFRAAFGAALAAGIISAPATGYQAAQKPPPPPPKPVPVKPAPPAKTPPAQQPNSLYNLFTPTNLNNAPAVQRPAPTVNNRVQRLPNANATASARTPAANLANARATQGPPVVSRNFPGHPAPPGSTETQTRNGSIVRKAADGSVIDVRNVRTGLSVHHALDGSRRITVEQRDHSSVYIPERGVQYVQHPFMFRGHPMVNRTLVVGDQSFHQVYRPFTYGNTNLDVYATSRYYAPNFYQWAATPFRAPEKFAWTYTTQSTPWFERYQGYFTPEPAYQTPSVWLTDYMLAATLFVAYSTKNEAQDPPPATDAPVTPEIKRMLANEVDRQVKTEAAEAQLNARNAEPTAAAGSIVQTLSDRQPHTFLVSRDLDLIDSTGRRCSMREADVIQTVSMPQPNNPSVDSIVLSSKGEGACGRSSRVQIALEDVQEMQNHMRETIDQGMANTKAGKQAPSVTPAFAAGAPPADANAANEISQQEQIAAAAES